MVLFRLGNLGLLFIGLPMLVSSFSPLMNKTIDFSSEEGKVAVYDHAMPQWLTSTVQSLFVGGDRWNYQYPDELAGISRRGDGNLDWAAPISPEFLMKSKLWIVLKRVIKDFTGNDDYMAYQATGVLLRRGDIPTVTKGDAESDDVFLRLCLSTEYSKRSEMLFLSKSGEVMKPVKAKYNRMIVWNANIDYQLKQPDYEKFIQEYSIIIKLTKDVKKLQDEVAYIASIRQAEQEQKKSNFPTSSEKRTEYPDEFYAKHLTRKFYDYRGGIITVFDHIMNETELAILRRYLIKHNTAYTNSGFTTVEKDDIDNVSWIAMFKPEIILGTRMLDIILGMGRYISGIDGWYPYDVSLNMVRNDFHTRIHEDCEVYEHEYTFLLYLNPNWTLNMFGETIFLNQIQNAKRDKKGNETREKAYETIVSVMPKYGRMVMFRNNIPHSARPPSPDFHGTRYTFAVKVSKTKMIGLAKILREVLEFKQEDKGEGGALYKKMLTEEETLQYSLTPEEMLQNIVKYRQEKDSVAAKDSQSVVTFLLRKNYEGPNQPSV